MINITSVRSFQFAVCRLDPIKVGVSTLYSADTPQASDAIVSILDFLNVSFFW